MMRGTSFLTKPLPKYAREPKRVSFQVTDRDLEILRALNRYRYMRTGQIHDLLFSENGTMQSARRRLRNLYHHRFVARAQPYVQVGKPAPEIAYFLDRKGREVLRSEGEVVRYWRKGAEVKYQFLEHAVAVSEFRLKLEKAVAGQDHLSLDRFIPDFEMRDQAEQFVGKKRYLLYREAVHPALRKSFVVHPDALIALSAERDGKSASRLLFLEVDRGTQGLDKIRDKLTGYHLAREQGLFRQFGEFSDFVVLFQAPGEKRAQSIFGALSDHVAASMARVATASLVSCESLLTQPIWKDMRGEMRRLVKA